MSFYEKNIYISGKLSSDEVYSWLAALHNVPSPGAVWLCCGGVGGVWFQGGGAWAWIAPPVSVQTSAEWKRAAATVFQSYVGADLRWTQTELMTLDSGLVLLHWCFLVAKRETEKGIYGVMGRLIGMMKSSVPKPQHGQLPSKTVTEMEHKKFELSFIMWSAQLYKQVTYIKTSVWLANIGYNE